MSYRVALLGKQDRAAFVSGSAALDRYFRERISQDVRRRVASCFVALDDSDAVAGFYTIAATSLVLDQLSPDQAAKLPRYPVVPAVLLGRLAVATAHQGKRLGGALLADALLRATRSEVMAYAMIVDAKDEAAARFYAHHGFVRLGDDRLRLIRAL
ncbi:GNAT family N-acetyltransferase [Sphingomonas sp. RT2P30]|uniref:GNAT family N-acetyltransferase n=1 Tax=Parasphingomonas halimpatiens TaxID=3096162 RepID=UPI002FCB5612